MFQDNHPRIGTFAQCKFHYIYSYFSYISFLQIMPYFLQIMQNKTILIQSWFFDSVINLLNNHMFQLFLIHNNLVVVHSYRWRSILNPSRIQATHIVLNEVIFKQNDDTLSNDEFSSSNVSDCHVQQHGSHIYHQINNHQSLFTFSHDSANPMPQMKSRSGYHQVLPLIETNPNVFQSPQINVAMARHNYPMYLLSPQVNAPMEYGSLYPWDIPKFAWTITSNYQQND